MTYIPRFNPFTGNMQYVNDYRAADTYSMWYWLTPCLYNNILQIKDHDITLPGNWSQDYADAGDNEYWYGSTFVNIPVGYKAVVGGFQALVYNGTNNYFDNLLLRAILSNSSAAATRTTTDILTVASPFGSTVGTRYYYTTSITTPPDMYGRDDSTTAILSELTVRYQVNKSGASGTYCKLYNHAFKIDYTKL